ncbi:MAG TPA: helix-turn-helix domain-containing protein [Candidatus Lustribacter sp.]|nr:helix-turn-helix domain-containing protein [Candidatus Lustribacter sp.]
MGSTVREALVTLGSPLTEDDVVAVLIESAERSARPGAAVLPSREREHLLADSGLSPAGRVALQGLLDSPGAAHSMIEAGRLANRVRLLADTLSAAEVADLLGITAGNVSRGASEGRLYSVHVGRGRRFPRWQFAGGQTLPGMAAIVAAVPRDLHPEAVHAAMTRANEALGGMSPVDWLAGGGSPDVVGELVSDLGRW